MQLDLVAVVNQATADESNEQKRCSAEQQARNERNGWLGEQQQNKNGENRQCFHRHSEQRQQHGSHYFHCLTRRVSQNFRRISLKMYRVGAAHVASKKTSGNAYLPVRNVPRL